MSSLLLTLGRRRGCVKFAVVGIAVVGFILGILALVPWLESARPLLVVGMATNLGLAGTLAIFVNWIARNPITYLGPIHHTERPTAYHLVSLAAFGFSVFLVIAGVHTLFRWAVS
jgi:hypothetical protein